MYESAIEDDLAQLELLTGIWDYQEYSSAINRIQKWKTLSSKKDEQVDPQLRDKVKNLRDEYKKNIGKLKETYFYTTPEQIYRQMRACAPMMEQLLDLTMEFSRRYEEEKRRRNLCDFHDLEHLALKILVERKDGTVSVPRQPGILQITFSRS